MQWVRETYLLRELGQCRAGADLFFAAIGEGRTNTITDFAPGQDQIELTLTKADLTFDDAFLSQGESDAIIQGSDTTIRLEGVDADDLREDDLLLGEGPSHCFQVRNDGSLKSTLPA